MSVARITTDTGRFSVRLVSSDSVSLRIELPSGQRLTMARSGVTTLERHGGRALEGALTLGLTGAGLGALAGVVLVAGLCDAADCSAEVLPAMVVVGTVFGAVGAGMGAIIGHNASWRPLDNRVRVGRSDPAMTCLLHPRIEGQLPRAPGRLSSHGQLNVGAVCGTGTVIGVDFARLGSRASRAESEVVDPIYGTVAIYHDSFEDRHYRGIFVERPLTTGAARIAGILMVGEYRTDSSRAESSTMKDYLPGVEWRDFTTKYPYRRETSTSRALGAGVGLKASIAVGPHLSFGFATRLHQVGSTRQQLESGVSASFRP